MPHYYICCHCPLFSTRSVTFSYGKIWPILLSCSIQRDLWGTLGAASMPQFLLLLSATAHHNLANAPCMHICYKGEDQPPKPGKMVEKTQNGWGHLQCAIESNLVANANICIIAGDAGNLSKIIFRFCRSKA